MKRKFPKIIYFLVCFLLVFQQSGFAQVAGELDLSAHFARLTSSFTQDKFRPLHLRYLSYDNLNNNFNLLLDKGDFMKGLSPKGADPEETLKISTKELLDYFFIGISLPNDSFWVNLRPDSPDNIIDPSLAKTDLGKILLEADLQLKKDTANFTSPQTPEGKAYWDKLYQKAGELFGSENITIPTLTRPWIVPNEIIIRESTDNAYIYKATLKVMLEQDYLKDSATYNFTDERLKQLNEYSSQLIRETIIPKLTKDINTAKRYAPLRQVYYSLILSQWFKQKFYGKGGLYSYLIDKKNLTGLGSKEPWSKTTYFQAYQKSFKEGEYNIKEQVYSLGAQTVRNYMSGGIALGEITRTIASSAIVSRREMFSGVKNLVELVVAGSQAANDPANVEISRRNFLKLAGAAAVVAAGTLNSTTVDALELAARSKPKPQSEISKQPGIKEKIKNPYEIPTDGPYITKLRVGIYKNLELTNQLKEIPPESLLDDSLIKYAGYSNSENSLSFVEEAYALLIKEGLYSREQKQYGVLFFPSLKMNSGQAIVLEDLNLIVIGRDVFQWLEPGILKKWLAIKILQETTRANYKGKMFLEREIVVHEVTLAAMKKLGGMPLGCVEAENKLLHTFKSIVENKDNAESVQYAFGTNSLEGISYEEEVKITLPQERGDPKAGIAVIALIGRGKEMRFGVTSGGAMGGVTEEWLKNVKTKSLFNIQRDFLIALSKGLPNASFGFNSEDSTGASSAIQQPAVSSSPVTHFDTDQVKAMDFLKNDPRAWVIFSDMLKLSLRNDYYGMNIADVFIADAIRISKNVLSEQEGISFRLGERSDEVAMVLPGSLQPENVRNILQVIQREIKNEYQNYYIARLPDGLVEKVKGAIGVREAQRTARENQEGGTEYITTLLFVKDNADTTGRLTLDRMLKESGLDSGLGEIEEALPPYLPAGAARLQGTGALENKFETSLKEAEIFQRVAKQAGELAEVEGLNERPARKEGAKLYDSESSKLKEYIAKFEASSQPLREFVKMQYGVDEANLIQLDDGYAAFMRRNLYEILEYAIEKAKSADSFIFAVRGPPDNFYIVTATKGKWQITAVRQNILTAEGSSLEKNFLSLIEASGRGLRAEGKYPFKVINDFEELGHYFGNQLIKLDNFELLNAFSEGIAKTKVENGILGEQDINGALSDASRNINSILNEKGFAFSVNFEAVSVTSDDFTGQGNLTSASKAAATLDKIEKLNAARKIVDIPDNSVKFYGEYKGRWPEIEKEIGSITAQKASNAKSGLEEIYKKINMPSETQSFNNSLRKSIYFCEIAKRFGQNAKANVYRRLAGEFNIGGVQFDALAIMGYWKASGDHEPHFQIRLENTLPRRTINIYVPETNILRIGSQGVDMKAIDSDEDAGRKIWGLVKEVVASPTVSSAVEYSDKGGIDFRALPAVIQPMGILPGQLPAGRVSVIPLAELNNEWLQIENMLNAGMTPSSDRLKIYLQSCCQKQDLNQDIDKVLACIADIFRLEEEKVAGTDLSLKEMLTLLESDKPASEMQVALAQITVEAKEPKLIEQ